MKEICPRCISKVIHRDGTRLTSTGKRQRWLCNSCNKRFMLDPISRVKGNMEAITLAMDLYFKGLSYRSIQDTLRQFNGLRVNHVTIMRWIHKYMKILGDYLDKETPKVGNVWHGDEQAIFVKGKMHYVWNCLDSKTRFLLANDVSRTRNINAGTRLFKKAKKIANRKAKKIITDGWNGYKTIVSKEFYTYSNPKPHIRYVSLRQPTGNNNKLERYHSSFRQRDKTMRGFKRKKGAKLYSQNYRTYYNFLRIHQKLRLTPAQKAGIDLPADWQKLLSKALAADKQQPKRNS